MALQEIIQQIETAAQKKIEQLEKEASLKLKELDKSYKNNFAELELKERKKIEERKKEILNRQEKEAEHRLAMRMLAAKNEILNEAFAQIKRNLANLALAKKKEILKKEFKKIKSFLGPDAVFICQNKKEIRQILKEVGLLQAKVFEKKLDFSSGFLVESKDFVVEISLEGIIEEALKENKDNFSKILLEN